jgi:hypothetical protein
MASSKKIEHLLRSEDAVPEHEIFEGSTTSASAVKLHRLRKKFASEGLTIKYIQAYRLAWCPLPEGLKDYPVKYRFVTTLMGSSAFSIDRLSEEVWEHPAESNVTNMVSQLTHEPWNFPIVSTGYYGIRSEPRGRDRQPSTISASSATAQPGPPAEPHKALKLENARREELVGNMHRLRALRLEHNST